LSVANGMESRKSGSIQSDSTSTSSASRMFYSQVQLRGGIPFDVRIPNADALKAMEELDSGKGERFNSADDLFKSWDED